VWPARRVDSESKGEVDDLAICPPRVAGSSGFKHGVPVLHGGLVS